MKRGFTILELLVASLLLGMLLTILTMLFNQSSVSWRTGVASVADLDEVRDNIAEVRDEADNAYVWNNKIHRILGLWDDQGNLRQRAWDVGVEDKADSRALMLSARASSINDRAKPSDFTVLSVGSSASSGSLKTYTVNVKSAGPDREFNTYDDIWSYPDEIN
jgi:prepilin-type N-terminal cleavage/methylation domain-containing protein